MNTKCKTKFTLMIVSAALLTLISCGGSSPNSQAGTAPPSNQSASNNNSTTAPNSSCTEAMTHLQASYAALQTCDTDTDCSYVDRYYEIVDRGNTTQFVTTFDCTAVTPFLVVANTSKLQAALPSLQAERKRQALACARPEGTVTCLAFQGFQSTPPPVCHTHLCQVTAHADGTSF